MNKKINIIYTRVSTDLQVEEGFSLWAQYKYLTEYCARSDIKNVVHIEDSGLSGRKTENSQGYQEMVRLIKHSKVQNLIFCKGDRICSNIRDHYALMEPCQEYNVQMISVMETADGRFVSGIFLLGAQLESEKISERAIFADIGMLKDGLFPFGRKMPLGLSKTKAKKLKSNKHIKIVQKIYDMYYIDNKSMSSINKSMK